MNPKSHTGIDLLLVDVPDNLPVSAISTSSSDIPTWNCWGPSFFDDVFTFAEDNLHDNGVFVIMHPDAPKMHDDIRDWALECHFTIARD
jgi:hypothetical protein